MRIRSLILLFLSVVAFLTLVFFIFKYKKQDWICSRHLVDKIYDWDTLSAVWLGRVRLLWIDTPEIYNKKYWFLSHKFYGCASESKEIAKKVLSWKNIMFCSDKLSSDKWKYGRKLRYAMINLSWNKTSFGYYLISKALAKTYRYANFSKKSKYLKKEKKLKKQLLWIRSKDCVIENFKQAQKYWTWECQIKWNISSSIGKVYYFPSDNNRKQVKINRQGEKMFCDHLQAEKEWFGRIWDFMKLKNRKHEKK